MVHHENSSKEAKQHLNNSPFVSKFSAVSMIVLILILPWFFNIQISEQVDSSKNILISIVIALLIIIWAITLFKQKELLWYASPLDKAIVIMITAALLSTVFSIHKETSIWGNELRQTGGLMSLFYLVIIFTVTFQNLRRPDILMRIIKVIPFSLSLYAIYIILKASNLLENLNQTLSLGINATNPLLDQLASPAGDIKALTILFMMALAINLFMLIDKKTNSILDKILYFWGSVFLILGIFTNINIDGTPFFKIIISLLSISTVSFCLIFTFKLNNKFSLAIILYLGLLGLTIIASLNSFNTPSNVTTIPLDTTTSIITNIVQTNPYRALVGTGLETYEYAFTQYRPETQNLRADWYINYTNGNSHFEGVIINSGLIGILGEFIFMYLILKFIAVKVLKARLHLQNNILLALCAATVLFVISTFITNHSILLAFFGWLILAVLFSYYSTLSPTNTNKYIIEFRSNSKSHSRVNLAPNMFSIVMIITGLIILLLSAKNLLSEIYFKQTLLKISEGQYEDATYMISKAINFNGEKDYYYSELASITMAKLNSYMETPTRPTDTMTDLIITNYVNDIESSLSKALELHPAGYTNWQIASIINKQLFKLLQEPRYEHAALEAIEQVLTRYPTSPDNYLLLAELYEIGAHPRKLELAEAAYTKAYTLQPSYIVSIMRLGKFLEDTNQDDLALALYSISKQEFYSTNSDFQIYLNDRIDTLKNKIND